MISVDYVLNSEQRTDVTLLLEGTYPYVRGGVSSWVHQLIGDLPDVSFSVIFMGSLRSQYAGLQYKLPSNLVHLETHYLMEPLVLGSPSARKGNYKYIDDLECMLEWLQNPALSPREVAVKRALTLLGDKSGMSVEDFFTARRHGIGSARISSGIALRVLS